MLSVTEMQRNETKNKKQKQIIKMRRCLSYHVDPFESMKFVKKLENVKVLRSSIECIQHRIQRTISIWLAAIM